MVNYDITIILIAKKMLKASVQKWPFNNSQISI